MTWEIGVLMVVLLVGPIVELALLSIRDIMKANNEVYDARYELYD